MTTVEDARKTLMADNPGKKITHLDALCVCTAGALKIATTPEEKNNVKKSITPNWLEACARDGNCILFQAQGFNEFDDRIFGDPQISSFRYLTQELVELLFANCKGDNHCHPCWLLTVDRRYIKLRADAIMERPADFVGDEGDWEKKKEERINERLKELREEGKIPYVSEEMIRKKIKFFIGQGDAITVEYMREFIGETVKDNEYLEMVSALLDSERLQQAVRLIKEKKLTLAGELAEKLFRTWIKSEGISVC